MDSTPPDPMSEHRLAYGLSIRSGIDFPELPHTQKTADVEVNYGHVSDPGIVPDAPDCVCYQVTPTEMNFLWPGAARFCVRDRREIIIEPIGSTDEHIIKLFVLGLGLATILLQRGYLVLHASAVSIAGKGILFLGTSGAGKSTTAAAFRAAGHTVLSDDAVAIAQDSQHGFSFSAGVSHLRLWPDSVAGVVKELDTLVPLHPLSKRSGWSSLDTALGEPLPLHRIYSLEYGADDAVTISRIAGRLAFMELVKHSHAVRCLADAGEAPNHFRICSQIAQHVPISSLIRPRSFDYLPNMIQSVIADCE